MRTKLNSRHPELGLRNSKSEGGRRRIFFFLAFFWCLSPVLLATDIVAHRGGKDLWPENTAFAFQKSVEIGADILEFDVQQTADGRFIVFHDTTLDRTTDGVGPVSKWTWANINQLDAGYRWTDANGNLPYRGLGITVPLASDIIQNFNDKPMLIELKETVNAELFCRELKELPSTDHITVGSFNPEQLQAFRRGCSQIKVFGSSDHIRNLYLTSFVYLDFAYRPRIEALEVPVDSKFSGGINLATRKFIRAMKRQGIKSYFWTVNDAPTMKRLINEGVDGIITDNPQLLKTIISERD